MLGVDVRLSGSSEALEMLYMLAFIIGVLVSLLGCRRR
jgi:hypothetical protein